MNPLLQEHLNIWDKKILPHLPKQLDELAAQTGAVQRKRGIRSAQDLLKILFLYACSDFSFRILATAACALGISDVSDTAWRKRFLKAVPFLHEILHRMLSSFSLWTNSERKNRKNGNDLFYLWELYDCVYTDKNDSVPAMGSFYWPCRWKIFPISIKTKAVANQSKRSVPYSNFTRDFVLSSRLWGVVLYLYCIKGVYMLY